MAWLFVRVAIAAVLVVICYRFEWHWLRNSTASIVVQLSGWLGLPVKQPASGIMEMDGTFYIFYLSCTMIDVFFAASALLWSFCLPVARNFLALVYLFFFVFALNILRLEAGFQLLHRFHVSNIVAHEIIGGVAYFIVLVRVVESHKKIRT